MKKFIQKATTIHGKKYSYDNVKYINNYTKIKIFCKSCNKYFEQLPRSHTSGHGCKDCGNKLMGFKNRLLYKDFIKKANSVHKFKYKYNMDSYKYYPKIKRTYVKVHCKEHGWSKQRTDQHIVGTGCPGCGRLMQIKNITKDTKLFIKNARKTHGDLYDYSLVNYVNSKTLVKIICPRHGEFEQMPSSHVYMHGCNKCFKLGEYKLGKILDKNKLIYIKEYSIIVNAKDRVLYDYYLPKLNILIEYDGIYHEKRQKQKVRDIYKNNLALEHKYNLIRITYKDFNNLEDKLLFELSKIYRYKVADTYYRTFLDVCKVLHLPSNAVLKDVEEYLVYNSSSV